jgi:hypothetical protein
MIFHDGFNSTRVQFCLVETPQILIARHSTR